MIVVEPQMHCVGFSIFPLCVSSFVLKAITLHLEREFYENYFLSNSKRAVTGRSHGCHGPGALLLAFFNMSRMF